MAEVLVVLAPGAEEIEVMTVADVLVRAGQSVTIATTTVERTVTGSRGLPLTGTTSLEGIRGRTYDVVYLPGGTESARTCREDDRIQELAQAQLAAGRCLAVICASVTALVPRALGRDRTVTSYPGVRTAVEPHVRRWLDQAVVRDGPLVTSQGPGTAMALGLTLARDLAGASTAQAVADALLTRMPT